MTTYTYIPQGVCSQQFDIKLDGEIISEVHVQNGCDGNLKGITSLLKGLPALEAIARLKGIRCGRKTTSCPDQLAVALEQAISKKRKGE